MKSTPFVRILIASIITLLSVNICVAATQLDDRFLKSNAGSSSVYVEVERLVEMIKNLKLDDGRHPKIVGWDRKGNSYTFTFITDSKVVLKFKHLLDTGGSWSSIAATADGKPMNALAFIMQVSSMPRDKTKFDIADEQRALEEKQQRAIEAALKMKKDLKLIFGNYGDGSDGGYGNPSVERTLTITPFSDDKVYFEFKSKVDDMIVCDTGKKVAGIQPSGFQQQYELLYEEDDCNIKIDFSRYNQGFEYYVVGSMRYRGTCQKYCNESFVSPGFKTGKGNLYPSVNNGMKNLDADIKMQNLSDKKEKESWK